MAPRGNGGSARVVECEASQHGQDLTTKIHHQLVNSPSTEEVKALLETAGIPWDPFHCDWLFREARPCKGLALS